MSKFRAFKKTKLPFSTPLTFVTLLNHLKNPATENCCDSEINSTLMSKLNEYSEAKKCEAATL